MGPLPESFATLTKSGAFVKTFPQIGLELVVGTRGSSTTFGVVKGTRIVKKAPNDTQTVKLSTDSGIDTD